MSADRFTGERLLVAVLTDALAAQHAREEADDTPAHRRGDLDAWIRDYLANTAIPALSVPFVCNSASFRGLVFRALATHLQREADAADALEAGYREAERRERGTDDDDDDMDFDGFDEGRGFDAPATRDDGGEE